MDVHKNARLTPKGREAMVRAVVEKGPTKAAAVRQLHTMAKTVAKWVDRFMSCSFGTISKRAGSEARL